MGQDNVVYEPIYDTQGIVGEKDLKVAKEEDPYYDCCENPDIITYRGIYVCRNCAIVFGPVIMDSPTRAFTPEEIEKKRMREPVYTSVGPRTIINVPKESKNKVLYLDN